MARAGWSKLIPAEDGFQGEDAFRIPAYSEFMPPPRLGRKPYGGEPPDAQLFDPADPLGWPVSEFQEQVELRPGLDYVAKNIVGRVWNLCHGQAAHGVSRRLLDGNLYWPE